MIKKLSTYTALSLFVLSSFGLTISEKSAAAYRRAHSSECHYYNDTLSTSLYNGAYLSNNTGASRNIYCPVATDGYLPHNAVIWLNVHGYEASGTNNTSRACAKHYTNTGWTCGASKSWGNLSAGVYAVDVSAWNANGASFPYLVNNIGNGGWLYGFYLAN